MESAASLTLNLCAVTGLTRSRYVKITQPRGAIGRFTSIRSTDSQTHDLYNPITLKRRLSPGDRFEVLVRPHFDALYSAARRMSRSPHDAEDLVQEVCIKAYSRLDELERIDFPRAWLLKVLYNKFVDSERRSGRSPVDIASTGAESDEPDLIAANDGEPDELVDREQHVHRVLRAMSCLNADHCALIAMHDVEGFSVEELCQLTGMPAGTIKAQLHRTRMKLGRLLSNDAMAGPNLKVVGGQQ